MKSKQTILLFRRSQNEIFASTKEKEIASFLAFRFTLKSIELYVRMRDRRISCACLLSTVVLPQQLYDWFECSIQSLTSNQRISARQRTRLLNMRGMRTYT